MDIDKLLHALNNEGNEAIVDLDYRKIAKAKNDILQQLNLPRAELIALQTKLKPYRYIDDLADIRYGSYIRWISLKNPSVIKLTNGGIICDIKASAAGAHNEVGAHSAAGAHNAAGAPTQDDIIIKCKNRMNNIFQIKMSEVILFQKLTEQEQVILSALKLIQG
jgi:hypothetical protein